ncbi:MAG: hypothetical protein FJ221_04175 [Lentisphaerae bacterium]|nr:hypothetical protein [Lentisphaerota bacterium]
MTTTRGSANPTIRCLAAALLGAAGPTAGAADAPDPVGVRPYELDWAHRVTDDVPALVDFEAPAEWTVRTRNAAASFVRTRRQQIWGQWVGELTYRGTNSGPEIRAGPAAPVPVAAPFDAVQAWVYGNNWGYARDASTPPVSLAFVFRDARGEFEVPLATVNWKEWHLCRRRLDAAMIERVRGGGVSFVALAVRGAKNTDDRTIWFDNPAVLTEAFPPLTFSARPRRGIDPPPGGIAGVHTGDGRLPFPTRPETILPPALDPKCRVTARRVGDAFLFTSDSRDGRVTWRYTPATGTFDDLEVRCEGRGGAVRPCVGGGVFLAGPAHEAVAPERIEPRGAGFTNGVVTARWRMTSGAAAADVTFTIRMQARSLVVDVDAPGGAVAEVRYGRATGLDDPRLVTNPYYVIHGGHPAVAVSGPPSQPLFLAGHTDWYLSNASIPWAGPGIATNGVRYNGGTRYIARTDGVRNGCFERFFLTLSTRYEEMLPVVANPVSPWKHVTGTRAWRAHGASNRGQDAAHWRNVRRHGMTQVVVTDHETGWRDGGESFTFRTRPAPGKGGDEGQFAYARVMQDELGFVYGPYNNFTDFAPVNGFWTPDLVSRTAENQLQGAWMRCYAPKPARAVEFCERLAPEIERKFGFSTAYCDVHTAVAPWDRVDYDPRVPGAGTFAATFYAYGEIMLLQKRAWGGPVYSEGNNHAIYCGLTDGNYAQDQRYRPAENPWLVDFDLRRLHDLGCNFGMGNPDMFFAGDVKRGRRKLAGDDEWLDHFLAATVAFGHPGFLTLDGGMPNALRSYYLLQQLHSRYCLTNADSIRYADADGRLLDTTAAVASGAYRRSQVVTRYADGTITAVNGHPAERMRVRAFGRDLDLPPHGYAGWTEDGAIEVSSGDRDGRRADYAATPAYLYADGRGRFTRFAKAASDGIGICRLLPGGAAEVIPVGGADCGFAFDAASAVALDRDNRELGPAALRRSRGLTYAVPVPNAFSYRLAPGPAAGRGLTCARDAVVPGETVVVKGRERHEFTIPADAPPGRRIWQTFEDEWIDFTVVPLVDTDVSLASPGDVRGGPTAVPAAARTEPGPPSTAHTGDTLSIALTSHAPAAAEFAVTAGPHQGGILLEPGRTGTIRFDLGAPGREDAQRWDVGIVAGGLSNSFAIGLRTVREVVRLAPVPDLFEAGIQVRGKAPTQDFGTTRGYARRGPVTCGGVDREGLAMHPPYDGATGCAFALFRGVRLPATPAAAFRALAGKGDGSDPGDGILYRVMVGEPGGAEREAAGVTVTNHAWIPVEADLSAWAGREVSIRLVADVGPRDNSSGDWAGWADLRIESREPQPRRVLVDSPGALRTEPPPHPCAGLTTDVARKAVRAWLRYEGQGLQGAGTYETRAVVNGIDIGPMAAAGGSETANRWSPTVGVPLTREAIATLGRRNRFELRNPGGDHFKIRRLWLDLELADGRRAATSIAAATWTQPPSWPHGEGIRVPADETIATDLWLDVGP